MDDAVIGCQVGLGHRGVAHLDHPVGYRDGQGRAFQRRDFSVRQVGGHQFAIRSDVVEEEP